MPPILRGFRVAVPVCVSAAVSFLSLRCRLLGGSHYTRPTYVVQIKSTQTTPKPLQTLAFIGVSQPHDGDMSTDHRDVSHDGHGTATARPCMTRHDRHDGHDRHDVNTIAPAQIPHDTPKHNRTNTPMLHIQQTPPVGSPPPGPSAGAGGTIAEIARGFLKSLRIKRDACKPPSRSAHGLQAVHNHVVQPLLHPFC